MSGSDFQRLTDNLACGRPGCPCGRASQNGTGLTHCPAHDDREPSLSCTEKGGKILIHCQAGCPQDRVVEALRERGLWPGYSKNVKGEGGTSIPPKVTATMQPLNLGQGCTLAQYAEAKKLPIGFLKGLGLSNVHLGQPAVRMPYLDRNGVEGAVRFRMALTDGDKFRWKTGAKLCLYGLQRLHEAQKAGYVVLVEGESDCHTLWHHHVPALGIPGADNWREERDADHLDGINTIYVLIEPDKGGETVKKWLAASKVRDRAWLVNPGEYKDPSELHVADPERFLERWSAALEAAVPWAEYAQSAADAQQRQAWALCQGLAREPNILDRFADILPRCGLAGERRAAKLVFLCMVSRFLKRPVSGAVKGPSSVGKSWLVDRVLDFFPSSAFHKLTGMSERALAYSEEPLAHRFLVLYEAAGLGGKFASYLVRSLLSEGRVRYETVEKTKDGLRPRLIEREGPTGLIVTTTAVRLDPETETRYLEIPVDDTPDQTRRVLAALVEEPESDPVDLAPWCALQTWLERAEHRVTIPYGRRLAELVPPVAVRLRRDFGAILGLIRTHAILHQASRSRDRHGRIIATLDDYGAVREFVADLVGEAVGVTVSPTIRETVAGVATLAATHPEGVTVAALATHLMLDKSAAWRRARVAQDRGYLKNLEDRNGRPARLVLGDALPDDLEVMPQAEQLQGCRVAGYPGGEYTPPQADDRLVF